MGKQTDHRVDKFVHPGDAVYLGAFMLGERVPLVVLCRDSTQSPVSPDAAPIAVVYPASGNPASSYGLPPADNSNSPGLFEFTMHLDGRYSPGDYGVLFTWLESGSARQAAGSFEVLPGGNADGAVIALYPYHRPHAEFLVQQLDSRKLCKGRNPTVNP